MLKIHQIFQIKFFLFFVATIIVSLIISYVALKTITINHYVEYLSNIIKMTEMGLDKEKNLDNYVKILHEQTGLRFTIIDNNGVVISESNMDKNSMENHGNRYQIIQSNKIKYASSTRYSTTLKVDFLYVATKVLLKKKYIYIRVSVSLSKVMDNFYDLWSRLSVIFIIIALVAFYASIGMSKRVIYDIDQITNYLNDISNKNYKSVVKTKYFYEFLQISLMLKNLVKKLNNREKQKRKYTAKLRLMNKQRNDILSAISHEFKNPVAAIMGYAQTLEDDPDTNVQIRKKFLSRIISNTEKISLMLDRLALSVKFDNNDLEIKESTFDLKILCDDVVTNILSKYKGREVRVHVDTLTIKADRTMLELAIMNLLDNALKYSEVDVEIKVTNDILSVTDNGIGIKEDNIDKVTSKFYRVNKNSWDNSMGIGLAMVSHILKAHHTTLDIKSKYAQGSTFSFNIKGLIA